MRQCLDDPAISETIDVLALIGDESVVEVHIEQDGERTTQSWFFLAVPSSKLP